jgi:hypothetical protein
MANRDRNLHVRIQDEEIRMLAAIAAREGDTSSGWLRRKIRETYRRLFGSVPPPAPAPKP